MSSSDDSTTREIHQREDLFRLELSVIVPKALKASGEVIEDLSGQLDSLYVSIPRHRSMPPLLIPYPG